MIPFLCIFRCSLNIFVSLYNLHHAQPDNRMTDVTEGWRPYTTATAGTATISEFVDIFQKSATCLPLIVQTQFLPNFFTPRTVYGHQWLAQISSLAYCWKSSLRDLQDDSRSTVIYGVLLVLILNVEAPAKELGFQRFIFMVKFPKGKM